MAAANPAVVEALELDVSKPEQVEAAAAAAGDVTLLINNAGVAGGGSILAVPDLDGLRGDFEVNVIGTATVSRAFAPALVKNGGALVNVISAAGLVNFPIFGGYSATKAALHSLTQNLRAELADKGVHVMGVYPGPIDTDMAKPLAMDKEPPSAVADATLRGLAEGAEEVYPDAMARELAVNLAADPKAVAKSVAAITAG